ncbi:dihydropyrimidine dehydrogenase, partial [Candidatus Bathyarchaeota archaeon]|nr:dihydropyrimidine dehydrogenase [Candidatus Bathyarchaeota archaeon]
MSKPKPKIKKEAVPMSKQDPKERGHNFNEVALGYTEEQVVAEAERCLQCAKAPCVDGCPVEVDIPAFIQLIRERKFDEAIRKVKE